MARPILLRQAHVVQLSLPTTNTHTPCRQHGGCAAGWCMGLTLDTHTHTHTRTTHTHRAGNGGGAQRPGARVSLWTHTPVAAAGRQSDQGHAHRTALHWQAPPPSAAAYPHLHLTWHAAQVPPAFCASSTSATPAPGWLLAPCRPPTWLPGHGGSIADRMSMTFWGGAASTRLATAWLAASMTCGVRAHAYAKVREPRFLHGVDWTGQRTRARPARCAGAPTGQQLGGMHAHFPRCKPLDSRIDAWKASPGRATQQQAGRWTGLQPECTSC